MVKKKSHGLDAGGNPQEAGHSAVVNKIHELLYREVGEAVDAVIEMETVWSQSEMTRRIVRYIWNSCKNEDLQGQPWRECVKNLVSAAMSSYSGACQEKEWFFEIQLIPAFISASQELLRSNRARPSIDMLEELVTVEYENKLDQILLVKAMWDATRQTFRDNDAVVNKVYAAVHKTYDLALTEAVEPNQAIRDDVRMERFMNRWINESMQRCWNSVENSERVITEHSVVKLFGNLVAPFGDDHPFSCIPQVFYDVDRPSRQWPYIRHATRKMFDAWARDVAAPSSKRRRKRKGGGEKEGEEDAVHAVVEESAEVLPELHSEEAQEDVADQALDEQEQISGDEDAMLDEPPAEHSGDGHPRCTSEEDCIGSSSSRLVQHSVPDGGGDLYCEVCWNSFLGEQKLEGVFQDTGEEYVP